MGTLAKVRFRLAWQNYRVGDVIEPTGVLRDWLLASGYVVAVEPPPVPPAEPPAPAPPAPQPPPDKPAAPPPEPRDPPAPPRKRSRAMFP